MSDVSKTSLRETAFQESTISHFKSSSIMDATNAENCNQRNLVRSCAGQSSDNHRRRKDDDSISVEPSFAQGPTSNGNGTQPIRKKVRNAKLLRIPNTVFMKENGHFEFAYELGQVARPVAQNGGGYRYECHVCKKCFHSRCDIGRHGVIHSGEHPFKCIVPNCGKRFQYRTSAQGHYLAHVKRNDIVPVPSPGPLARETIDESNTIMGEVGGSNMQIGAESVNYFAGTADKEHFKYAHELGDASQKVTNSGGKPRYQCPKCNRTFGSRGDVRRHCVIHTGEHPFLCVVPGCAKRFQFRSSAMCHHKEHVRKGEVAKTLRALEMERMVRSSTVQNQNSVNVPPQTIPVEASLVSLDAGNVVRVNHSNEDAVQELESSEAVPAPASYKMDISGSDALIPTDADNSASIDESAEHFFSVLIENIDPSWNFSTEIDKMETSDVKKDDISLEERLKLITQASSQDIEDAVKNVSIPEDLEIYSLFYEEPRDDPSNSADLAMRPSCSISHPNEDSILESGAASSYYVVPGPDNPMEDTFDILSEGMDYTNLGSMASAGHQNEDCTEEIGNDE